MKPEPSDSVCGLYPCGEPNPDNSARVLQNVSIGRDWGLGTWDLCVLLPTISWETNLKIKKFNWKKSNFISSHLVDSWKLSQSTFQPCGFQPSPPPPPPTPHPCHHGTKLFTVHSLRDAWHFTEAAQPVTDYSSSKSFWKIMLKLCVSSMDTKLVYWLPGWPSLRTFGSYFYRNHTSHAEVIYVLDSWCSFPTRLPS